MTDGGDEDRTDLEDVRDACKEAANRIVEFFGDLPGWKKLVVGWAERVLFLLVGVALGEVLPRLLTRWSPGLFGDESGITGGMPVVLYAPLVVGILLLDRDRYSLNVTGGVVTGAAVGAQFGLGGVVVLGALGFKVGELKHTSEPVSLYPGSTVPLPAAGGADPDEDDGEEVPGIEVKTDAEADTGEEHAVPPPDEPVVARQADAVLEIEPVDGRTATVGTAVTFRVHDRDGPVEQARVETDGETVFTDGQGCCDVTYDDPGRYGVYARLPERRYILAYLEVVIRPEDGPPHHEYEYDIRAKTEDWGKYPGDTYTFTVVEPATDDPIPGATLEVPDLKERATTDDDGTCEITVPDDTPGGFYDITISAEVDGRRLEPKPNQRLTVLEPDDSEGDDGNGGTGEGDDGHGQDGAQADEDADAERTAPWNLLPDWS